MMMAWLLGQREEQERVARWKKPEPEWCGCYPPWSSTPKPTLWEQTPGWYWEPKSIWPELPSKPGWAWLFVKGVGRYVWGEFSHLCHEVYLGCCTDMQLDKSLEIEVKTMKEEGVSLMKEGDDRWKKAARSDESIINMHGYRVHKSDLVPAMLEWDEEMWHHMMSPPDISALRINWSAESTESLGNQDETNTDYYY